MNFLIIIIILVLIIRGCFESTVEIPSLNISERDRLMDSGTSFREGIIGVNLSIFSGDIGIDFDCFDGCIFLATMFGGCYDTCDTWYCDVDDESDDCLDCEYDCDMDVWACIFDECIVPGDAETYIWDGGPVDNYGTFFEESYPIFHEQFSEYCESDFWSGTWVADSNTMGCVDADVFWYEDCVFPAISSAAEVCESIGGTWTCDGDCSSADWDCEESNAILTCTR